MNLAIINGPNLNLLGNRETDIYGTASFDSYLSGLKSLYPHINLSYFQSNVEGEIINAVQKFGVFGGAAGLIINAGGYSHTSVAIADAVKACTVPVVSVHISNIYAREPQRHVDLLGSYATGQIVGLGLYGYRAALQYLFDLLDKG